MLTRVAETIVRRRRLVLLLALGAFVLAGVFGGGVAKRLSSGGFNDPGAPSSRANNVLRDQFHTGDPNLVLLVTAKAGSTVDSAAVAEAGQALTSRLGHESAVNQASSYWSLGEAPPLRSKDGTQALVLARLSGSDDQVAKEIKALAPRYELQDANIDVKVGGQAEVFHEVGSQVQKDLEKAELYSFLPTVILLLLVFGGVVAASLPLAIGALQILGTFAVLRIMTEFTHVSIFSLNLTTALGLGLAIDYSLFILYRYREEMHRGLSPNEAIVRTVQTVGRTVLFTATTVAISLAALLVFPMYFLKSFAYAGIAVAVLDAIGAVIILPAILAVLGTRIDKATLWHHRPVTNGQGFWHGLATTVMRRPLITGGAVIAVLLVLGSPFLRINFGLPDDRALPAGAGSRQVQDAIRTNFGSDEAGAVEIVAPSAPAGTSADAAIGAYAARLSRLSGVGRVDAATGSYVAGHLAQPASQATEQRFSAPNGRSGTWLSAVPTVEPESTRGETLVKTIRSTPAPFPVLVGGQSAQLVDSKASLFGKLPIAGGIVALVTLIVLFLMTGSVVVPLKAIVLNLLSLTATFGAMVWVFQEGHLAHLLHFTPTGTIDTTTPILMFCIAFGLSMDYEVFMLSRIKEEHDRTGQNVPSVATGLERTGRILTAAALLLAVVFLAFATSQVTFIKLFGIGLAMAILVDATLVRGVLVPAFMRLAGDANWWAPAPLRRLYLRIGLSDSDPEIPVPEAPVQPEAALEEVA